MKRFWILLLALIVLLSVASCGGSDDNGGTSADGSDGSSAAELKSYEEYMAAEDGSTVTVEAYVQIAEAWRSDRGQGNISVYLQDRGGAYLVTGMICTEENAKKLVPGVKIRVTGEKSSWNEGVRITSARFEFVEGADPYIASETDVTALLGTSRLIKHQNKYVSFTRMTVEAIGNAGDTFFYKWDNAGSDGDDLYFKVSDGRNSYTFIVNAALTGAGTDVYEAVKALNVGDVVNMKGFLYWNLGISPYITSVTLVTATA